MQLLLNFIKAGHGKSLTHLNLSGVEALVQNERIANLLENLADQDQCPNLMSLHLNELQLESNDILKERVVKAFRVADLVTLSSNQDLSKDPFSSQHRARCQQKLETVLKDIEKFDYLDIIQNAV